MYAAHRPVRRNFVTLADFILDSAVKVRECRSEYGDQLLETHPVGGHSPTHMMADTIGRNEFIHDSQVALSEGFVKNAVDDGLALNS